MSKYQIALKTLENIGTSPPEWFQVFPSGQVEIQDDQPVFISEQHAREVISKFKSAKKDMVIDYEHATLTGQPAPAAGWIRDLEWRGAEGLWAKSDWTEKAAGYISAQEYRYYSPVFIVRKHDRSIAGLHNVALTNQPKMNGLRALAAKDIILRIEGEGGRMGKLIEMLGLQADADEAAVIAAVEKLLADLKAMSEKQMTTKAEVIALPEVFEALSLKSDAGKSELLATIHAMKQAQSKTADWQTELMTLKAKIAERETADLVREALTQGKITPAQRDWAEKYALSDPDGFRLFTAKAPVVVPVGTAAVLPDKKQDSETDEIQAKINRQLGVTPEMLKKYPVQEG